ncbi:hypothetical protein [Actinocorallia longicatena]|uniref:Uncharacterized protein n=1 Tax=Actinocorallia longicatena TaxID=111803 RepID=A0ABP6QGN4_9ACTN
MSADSLRLLVNGVQVVSILDSELTVGGIGLAVAVDSPGNRSISFGGLSVWHPAT